MDNRFIACATALVAAGMSAGCSSPEPVVVPPGTLPGGTAEVSINGNDPETTEAVTCATIGSVTTINTGADDAGTTSSVTNSDGLAVQFAQIRGVGGFTGSYWAALGPIAKVQMVGPTFELSGKADGFNSDNPSARTTGTFSIKVTC